MEQERDVLVIHAPQPIFYPICVPLLKGGHLLETGFPSCGRWRNYWGASNSSCSLAPPFMLLCCKLADGCLLKDHSLNQGATKKSTAANQLLNSGQSMLLCIWNFISSCSLLLSDLCSNISFSPFSPLGTKGKAFGRDLPRKLLLGLTSLFISIAAMLFTLCTGGALLSSYRWSEICCNPSICSSMPACNIFCYGAVPILLWSYLGDL